MGRSAPWSIQTPSPSSLPSSSSSKNVSSSSSSHWGESSDNLPCFSAISTIASCRSPKPSPWAAEMGIGVPKPRPQASAMPDCPALPSHLLPTISTSAPDRRIELAKKLSAGVMPSLASKTSKVKSARLMAFSVCCRILSSRLPVRASSRPAVSISLNSRAASRPWPSRRSRVTPGLSSTMACLRPVKRLNSVDFPTLGRPTIAIEYDMKPPKT